MPDRSEFASESPHSETDNHKESITAPVDSNAPVEKAAPSFQDWQALLEHVKLQGFYPLLELPAAAAVTMTGPPSEKQIAINQLVGEHIAFNWNVGWSVGQIKCSSKRKAYNCEVKYEGEDYHRVHHLSHRTYAVGPNEVVTGAWCLLARLDTSS